MGSVHLDRCVGEEFHDGLLVAGTHAARILIWLLLPFRLGDEHAVVHPLRDCLRTGAGGALVQSCGGGATMMRPRLQHRDVGGDGGAVLPVVAVHRDCGEDFVQVHLHDVRVAIHRARVEQRRCSRHRQRRQRQPMREEGVLIGRGVATEACMETLGLEEHELEERALPPRHLLERLR